MRVNSKASACLQIVAYLYLIFFNAFIFSFPAVAETHSQTSVENKKSQPSDEQERAVATTLSSAGSLLNQSDRVDSVINSVVNSTTQSATSEIQNWLQGYGTARVNVGLDSDFSLSSADVDLLFPLYDNGPHLIFSQTGIRRADDRNIINLGTGYRHFYDSWMWGVNAFFDQQLSDNTHQRFGVGSELAWDYLKFSGNGYMRLSGWKNSTRHEDYQERVANGYDLRAEGYLPAYPQLGMQLMWEQYYGDDVALFGDDQDQRQRDPYAVTAGVNYTPFPLMTVGVNHKEGKGNQHDTQTGMNINWVIGAPFSEQIDPDSVNSKRTLRGSRLDLVSRNNSIVLEYRKKDLISLTLPKRIEGEESQTLPITIKTTSKYPLSHIDWQDAGLISHGGKIINNKGEWSVFLPAYQQSGEHNNVYVMSATAYDSKGNQSEKAWVTVEVKGFNPLTATTKTTTTSTSLMADGVSSTPVLLTITSGSGVPISGLVSQLSTQLIRSVSAKRTVMAGNEKSGQESITTWQEQSPGVYASTFTSGTTPGTVIIQPKYKNSLLSKAVLTLVAANTQVHFDRLDVPKTTALANGQDVITLSAHVVNETTRAAAAGVPVAWQVDNASAILSTAQSVTDAQGNATVKLTSQQLLEATVTAQLENGESVKSKMLQFIADDASALPVTVTASKTSALADGKDEIALSVKVEDAGKNPVQGANVSWLTASATAHLSASSATTDDNGMASITVTSSAVEALQVSANVMEHTQSSPQLSFTANSATANVKSLLADKTQATSNDVDRITLSAKVVDASDHPLVAPLKWTIVQGEGTLSAAETVADAQGDSAVTLTAVHPGTVVVSASSTAGAAVNSADLTFVADTSTGKVTNVTVDKTEALANGSDTVTYRATVQDAQGNLLGNQVVNWSATPASAKLSATTSQTDENGVATMTLTTKIIGKVMTTAQAGSGAVWNAPDVEFSGDSTTAQVAGLMVSKSTAVANGADSVTITGLITDAYGNPLSNISAAWSITPASGVLSATTSVSDAQGKIEVVLKSTEMATYQVTARIAADEETSEPITFKADTATAAIRTLTADKTADITAGRDTVNLTAEVKDNSGLPIEGATVTWSGDNAKGVFSANSTTTDSSGKAVVTYQSTLAMATNIVAKIDTGSQKNLALTMVPDLQSAGPGSVTTDKTSATANGSDTIAIMTTVKDQYGNLVPQQPVNWSVSPALDFQLSATTQTTDAQGQSRITMTSTDRGIFQATATFNSLNKTSSKFGFASDTATEKVADIVASKTTGVVAGKDVVTLQATITDENDNPVQNAVVYWGSDNDSGVFTSDAISTTNSSGVAEINFTATTAQPSVVGAAINHSRKTLTLSYIGDESTPHLVALKADKKSAVADGTELVTWTASVQDANGNNLPNVSVNWSSSRPELSFNATSSVTDAQGNAVSQGYTIKSGDVVVTATLPVTQQTLSAEKATFIADAKTAEVFELTPDKIHALSNNSDQVKLAVTVHDKNDNLVPNMQVQWSTSLNTLSATTSQTDADGNTSVTLSGKESGRITITAKTATGSTVLQNNDIIFGNMIEDTWVINSADSQYSSARIKGFSSLGFVTISPTQGPTSLSWAPTGYSNVSTPVTLTGGDGKEYMVNLKGYRSSGCSTRPLNAAAACQSNSGMSAKFTWSQADNPSLPAGHYTGVVNFAGKDWNTSYAFYYKLTMDLTVN